MSEINTSLILDGITLALREAFPKSQIESKAVKQGLCAPAFIVLLASASQVSQPSGRLRQLTRFDVVYFPRHGREDCYKAATKLCDVLEVITLPGGDKLRGSDISFSVADNELHFLVSYNYFAYRENEETPMGSLKIQQGGM